MPSRWLCLPIVLFWLTTMGWLFWHDLWPSWRPGEPPPFYIDPVEEVRKGDPLNPIFWSVQRKKPGEETSVEVFSASTWVVYRQVDDTCELHARLDAKRKPVDVEKISKFEIERVTSKYVVARGGQLRSLQAKVQTATISLTIKGEVRDDQFFAHCRASLPKPFQFDLPPTSVSPTASVLMPLHPLNRIRGLRPGQSWRQPLVDPLRDAFASLPGLSGGVRSLNARVLPQPQVLKHGDSALSCLVVEYIDDENQIVARTWVEQDSERVQQQEANLDGVQWIMRRELSPGGFGRLPIR